MTATKIAIMGVGKIARDQHIPAIAADPRFELAATVSRSGGVDGVENFATLSELIAARPDIPAVSLCMPPSVRYEAAAEAIAAGKQTMLEKPPGATVAEVLDLARMAEQAGVTLFATWHSRHAEGVAAAKAWLADKTITALRIDWKEDVRKWHPGQDWIWEPGNLGVFDPGINALSILTEIVQVPLHLTGAELSFPENRAAPIAADLTFAGPGFTAEAAFDWRQEGGEIWQIAVETTAGTLRLIEGGSRLFLDDAEQSVHGRGEYPDLYHRFGDLIDGGTRDVDAAPLIHVADAFLLGRRLVVEPFNE